MLGLWLLFFAFVAAVASALAGFVEGKSKYWVALVSIVVAGITLVLAGIELRSSQTQAASQRGQLDSMAEELSSAKAAAEQAADRGSQLSENLTSTATVLEATRRELQDARDQVDRMATDLEDSVDALEGLRLENMQLRAQLNEVDTATQIERRVQTCRSVLDPMSRFFGVVEGLITGTPNILGGAYFVGTSEIDGFQQGQKEAELRQLRGHELSRRLGRSNINWTPILRDMSRNNFLGLITEFDAARDVIANVNCRVELFGAGQIRCSC